MADIPIIWTLTDDRPGNRSQALGLAEALQIPFVQKEIRYNSLSSLPNYLLGRTLVSLNKAQSAPFLAPWPEVIIAAGRRTLPIARYIKKQTGGKAKLIQLMWPGYPLTDIDLIITPKHDNITQAPCALITTTGAVHRINADLINHEYPNWELTFHGLPEKRIAVLIGGTTSKGAFTLEHAKTLLAHLNAMAEEQHAALLITTSRRTPDTAIDLLKHGLTVPNYFHDWRTAEGDNPYFGMLAHASTIVVTGDSMSMCSEAAATGKPVYIYADDGFIPTKHKALHQTLYDYGAARPLAAPYESWEYSPLNESTRVGKEVTALLFQPEAAESPPIRKGAVNIG